MMQPVSTAQRINGERLILLGWTRAILLQFAHPLIAAGVSEHSTFSASRTAPLVRLRHTVQAMLDITFGDAAAQGRALAGIRAIHRRVRGALRESVGPWAAGTPYSAEDPALLLWVHATLIDSIVMAHDAFVEPLSLEARDAYCAEAAATAIALGAVSADVPRSWTALQVWLSARYASGEIVVGADARSLAARVLSPPITRAISPALALNQLLTIGMLPGDVRRGYGFDWTPPHERRWTRWCGRVRGVRSHLPRSLALWPEYRRVLRAAAPGGRTPRAVHELSK